MNYDALLLAVAPRGKPAVRNGFAAALPQCQAQAVLSTDLRLAHFLAQCAHESDGLKTTVEYASGRAYEGRRDLGNAHAGDGPRYRGRGVIQLTGRANYREYGTALGVDLEAAPEKAAAFPLAGLVAAEYWKRRRVNDAADRDDLVGVTSKINGGRNGLESRRTYLTRAKAALKDLPGELRQRAGEERETARKQTTHATGAAVATGGASTAASSHSWQLAAGVGLLLAIGVALIVRNVMRTRALAVQLDEAAKAATPAAPLPA